MSQYLSINSSKSCLLFSHMREQILLESHSIRKLPPVTQFYVMNWDLWGLWPPTPAGMTHDDDMMNMSVNSKKKFVNIILNVEYQSTLIRTTKVWLWALQKFCMLPSLILNEIQTCARNKYPHNNNHISKPKLKFHLMACPNWTVILINKYPMHYTISLGM